MMKSPHLLFGLLTFGSALLLTALVSRTVGPIPAWLLSVNLVAVAAYRYDKFVAGSDRTRVPERVLLLLASAGGAIGAAIAMWLIQPRHKTKSTLFLFWFLLIVALELGALWYMYQANVFASRP